MPRIAWAPLLPGGSPARSLWVITKDLWYYDLGGAAGPVLGGAALDLWGPHGLPLAVGLALVAFLLFAALRRDGGEGA